MVCIVPVLLTDGAALSALLIELEIYLFIFSREEHMEKVPSEVTSLNY